MDDPPCGIVPVFSRPSLDESTGTELLGHLRTGQIVMVREHVANSYGNWVKLSVSYDRNACMQAMPRAGSSSWHDWVETARTWMGTHGRGRDRGKFRS